MKTKLLSLLLVITLLAVTVSTGLPTILAAYENLFTNGDFADYSGYTPTGWKVSVNATNGGASATIEKAKPDGENEVNAIHLVTTKEHLASNGTLDRGSNKIYSTNTFKVEKNATYTITYWVKTNIGLVTLSMYEPNYIDRNGVSKTNELSTEGQNIYSYSYDNGSTRVSRVDIAHSIKVAQSGNPVEAGGASMAIARLNSSNANPLVISPDYPAQERINEWTQVIHTFSTGNFAAHEADVAYAIHVPSVVDGDFWVADFKANVVKSEIDDYYTAAVNDDKLGCTTKDVPLINGKVAEITAEAYGENKFDGWFVDGELVSEEETFSFTYDPNNPPKYEARFTKAEWGIDGSLETGYTNGELLAQAVTEKEPKAAGTDWTPTTFLSTDKASKGYYVESNYGGVWRKANITQSYTHSGKTAIEFAGQYGMLGRKFSGLDKNTEYKLAAYIYSIGGGDGKLVGLGNIAVTDANTSSVGTRSNGTIDYYASDAYPGVLAWDGTDIDATKGWTKVEITFNSKESTEVILWLESAGLNAKMYIDDYSIARVPAAFKPQVNDANLGFASPAEGVVCVPGDEVTFTATPLDGNYFEGWYAGDKLVSTEPVYTFVYSTDVSDFKAHFKAGDVIVPNAGFEDGYTNDQVLAQALHTKPTTYDQLSQAEKDKLTPEEQANWKTDWNHTLWLNTTKDDVHYIESNNGGTYRKAAISTTVAHSGKNSLALSGMYGYLGKKFTGLKKDTNYAISFYANIKENTSATIGSFKISKPDEGLYNEDASAREKTEFIMTSDNKYSFYDEWGKIILEFNSGDNTEIILWMNHNNIGTVYLDDFAIFEPITTSISADLGGSVTSNLTSKIICKGTRVTISATPLEGNTFAGWFDPTNKLVSADAEYTFVAEASFNLTAKFEGYNMPARDYLALQGYDGTFESYGVNDGLPEWTASDPTYTSEWCKYTVSNFMAYEGKQSLKLSARYRNSIFAMNGLVSKTDYRLTFYIAQPDSHQTAKIDSMGIIGENDTHLGSASTILNQRKLVVSNTGWNRIDLYFNSGENVNLKFILRYSTDLTADNVAVLFIDNMSLTQYKADDELVNGDFEDGKTNWVGGGAATTDGTANVFGLAANESIYQSVNVDSFSTYKVSFKAKGKLTAAAQDIAKVDLGVKNYISSVSYVDADGTEWTEYSYEVYSGIHEAMNLVFAADDAGAMIDDVKFVKKTENANSILEKIDFESERFDLTSITDNSVYSIYTATEEDDPYVYSGNKALKFTYNELLADTSVEFKEAWLSYQTGTNNNFKITMKYKIVGGKAGGFIGLAPEYSGTYGADSGFEHMADNEEWKSISFFVNNTTHAVFKAKIASVIGNTAGDFYVDDIVISVAPPMVNEENSKTTYCERLYNAIDNEGFENAATDADWKNLPPTAKIVKGEALKGSHFLRASAGTHYVLEVPVKAGFEYYFAASIRGTASTVGRIGVTIDKEGKQFFANRDEKPASIVEFNPEETGWKRSGFKFTTDGGGIAYIVIDVESGALDIDSVMMFTTEYGYRYDPNDYTIYVSYDYDNLKSPSTVINGGYGDQPYYDEDLDGEVGEESVSPSTGDSLAMPVVIIVLAVIASAVLMLIRKRKEGAENA